MDSALQHIADQVRADLGKCAAIDKTNPLGKKCAEQLKTMQ